MDRKKDIARYHRHLKSGAFLGNSQEGHPQYGSGEGARLCQGPGSLAIHTLIVGCEPAKIITGEDDTDMQVGLSEPVQAAVDEAVKMIDSLVGRLLASTPVT